MAKTFFGMERGNHDQPLDIHDYLVKNPSSTYFIKKDSDGPDGADIKAGDVLVIDRSLSPKRGAVVLVVIEGEFQVVVWSGNVDSEDVTLWGVVIGLLRKFS